MSPDRIFIIKVTSNKKKNKDRITTALINNIINTNNILVEEPTLFKEYQSKALMNRILI